MRANAVYPCLLIAVAWVFLQESFSFATLASALVIGVCSLLVCYRLFPLPKVAGISFLRLGLFILYMFGQIFVAGLTAIKLIVTGARVEVLKTRTSLTNDIARTFLANSITTIPGTITIDLVEDELTVLCLCGSSDEAEGVKEAEEYIIHSLESRLKSIEK